MKPLQRAWRACLLGLVLLPLAWLAGAADDLLPPEQAFAPTVAMADPLTLDVHYQIAPDYYLYQERFELRIEDAGGRLLAYRPSALTPPEARSTDAAWPGAVQLPQGLVKYDPVFEQDMEVYHDGVTLRTHLQPQAAAPLRVELTSQGCADVGVCYPPMTQAFTLVAAQGGYQAQGALVREHVPAPRDSAAGASQGAMTTPAPGAALAAGTSSWLTQPGAGSAAPPALLEQTLVAGNDTGLAAWLHQAPLWQILLLSLAFGALLSLTPCVLPMVPILLALITGGGRVLTRWRGLGLAALYVLGMSLVYMALGVVAGLLGAGLAAWLQSPWVLGVFAALLALLALAMLDVFTFQVPGQVQGRLQAWLQRLPGGRAGAVFIMGAVSAVIVGPCVAAPLAGVLLFISQSGDWLVGGSALFAMAWGEGLLLLIVGAGAGALVPRAGAWMVPLKAGFGVLLLATAWWLARPLLGAGLYIGVWVLLALWAALLLHAATQTDRAPRADATNAVVGPWRLLLRALALALCAWALAQGAGLLAGGRDMLRPLSVFRATGSVGVPGVGPGGALGNAALGAGQTEQIRAWFTPVRSLDDLQVKLATAGRPAMLDFYADWCVSCLEMEKFTFSDPRVAQRMQEMLLLQADVTRMTAEDRALLARFQLFGPPGIMFFDAKGELRPQERVVGFLDADAFLAVLGRVLAGG